MSNSKRKGNPLVFEKFGGIADAGAAEQVNFRVSGDGRLVKRHGYVRVCEFENDIRGMWYGGIGGLAETLYCVAGRYVYRRDGNTNVQIGTLSASGSGRCAMFRFEEKLYITDGASYYVCTGTAVSEVAGYIPLLCAAAAPDGSGDDYEEINRLTRRVRMRFVTQSGVTNYYLRGNWLGTSGVLSVRLDGTSISAYTAVSVGGKPVVRLTNAPSEGQLLDVFYTLAADASQRASIAACRYAVSYDTKNAVMVFLYGGTSESVMYVSEPENRASADRKTASAVYFPEYSGTLNIGGGRSPVNAALRQFDSLLVYTGAGALLLYRTEFTDSAGYTRYQYPVYTLSDAVGAAGKLCAAQADDKLYSLDVGGLYEWVSSYNQGSRAARLVSGPVAGRLTSGFIANAVLHVLPAYGELWLADTVTGDVLVYNCRLDAWYTFDGIAADGFSEGDRTYFRRGSALFAFEGGVYTDDGQPFASIWESHWQDLGSPHLNKYVDRAFLTLGQAGSAGGAVSLTLTPDVGDELDYEELEASPYNPVTHRLRSVIRRFRFLKLTITDTSSVSAPVESVRLLWGGGGETSDR